MGKITTAVFEPGSTTANVYGLWQYDYGQILRIQGLNLPSAVEIHFSLQETGGTSVSRVGVTKDGVTDVIIPDSMLENDGATRNYDMFAFVYLTDDTSGQTEYKIKLQVKSRPKPEVFDGGENPNIFHEAVQAVKKSADKAAESEKQAEGWAHGREDLPERAQDNAKYYAGQTAADAKKTGTDRKEVERLVESVSDIDQQVTKVENLTKQAQTSATNAALSEQAAKTAETNAQTAQAGAETAEGNAELAEQGAKASEQAVEKAKQLVTQMGQEVLDNKNHVDQTVQAFTLTAQQAVAGVNNAGQTQTERVQSTGNTAVESVKTAQTAATQAVETAKTEAVKAVQIEGTNQTGNVTQEGEKQVQAVQTAAQEIVADREQIQENKAEIEGLKQGKADAIVETASGENIRIEDSSGLGFEGLRIFGKSTQDGVPSMESLKEIKSVGSNGSVNVKVAGKNLCPGVKKGAYGNLDGNYITSDDYTCTELVEVRENVEYCESNSSAKNFDDIHFFDKDRRWISKGSYLGLNKRPANTQFIAFNYFKKNVQWVQIEEGTVATSYEPYRTPRSITLSTPNGLPGIKVDSGGNYTDKNGQQWICDEKDYGRGKYVQRIWMNPITEKSTISSMAIGGYNRFSANNIDLAQPPGNEKNIGMCNCLKASYKPITTNSENDSISCYEGGGVHFRIDRFKTVEELKEWLKNNPIIYYYVLITPIEHDLTPEEIVDYKALHTNYPTTVISNDESAHMEVSYVADTKNYIVSKIEIPLQKQITDLQNALISQKISGGGIKVTDSAKVPVVNFAMWGKTEQVKTAGTNLFDVSKIEDTWNGSYGIKNNNGVLTVVSNSSSSAVDTNKTLKELCPQLKNNETYVFNAVNSGKSNMIYLNNAKKLWFYNQSMVMTEEMLNSRVYLYISDKINDSGTIRNIQVNRGETVLPYEPYSGGFLSPSPDWEQPIEVTDKPVTVTIKGGTEQQSITLVPPRPLTKWDKLEKVDGVWRWMYQHGDYTITGDENFLVGEESYIKGSSTNCFAQILKSPAESADAMMERLSIIDSVWSKVGTVGFCTNIDQLHMRLPNSMLGVSDNAAENEKIAAYKAYIKAEHDKGVPYHVVYKTSTPEYIPLPQPVQDKLNALTMYAGTTEITNDGGCNMELTYTVDTQSYVDTKIAEVSKAII